MANLPALGLKLPSRCVAPLPACNNAPTWLLGTTSLRGANEVQAVEYDTENECLRISNAYSHPAEIWDLDASPTDANLLGTVHSAGSSGGVGGVTLWKAHPLAAKLTPACDLSAKHSTRARQLQWNPQDSSSLFTLEAARLHTWAIREASAEASGTALAGDSQELGCAAWDPNSSLHVCTAEGGHIQVWDLRQRRRQHLVHNAHTLPIRYLDFAKQRQHCLASCGEDGRIKIWDMRAGGTSAPLIDLAAHQHWVWRVQFNPTYDNLLISCSSDNTTSLWHINLAAGTAHAAASPGPKPGAAAGAAAAAAAGSKPSQSGGGPAVATAVHARAGSPASKPAPTSHKGLPPTGRLTLYSGHQDSVYGVAWNPLEPWSWVSLSFDGRLVLHTVPQKMKYALLI